MSFSEKLDGTDDAYQTLRSCIISVIRLTTTIYLTPQVTGRLPPSITKNMTAKVEPGAYRDIILYSAIEPAVALISACLPSLPILRRLWIDRFFQAWKRRWSSRRPLASSGSLRPRAPIPLTVPTIRPPGREVNNVMTKENALRVDPILPPNTQRVKPVLGQLDSTSPV